MSTVLLFQISNDVSCFLAICLNSLLLHLIRNHSNSEMGNFRYILANTAATDLLLGIVWAAIQNVRVPYCGTSTVVILGFANQLFGPNFCAVNFVPDLYTFNDLQRPVFSDCFHLRYFKISSLSAQSSFTTKKMILSFLSVGIYGIVSGSVVSLKTPMYQNLKVNYNVCVGVETKQIWH